MSGDYSRDSFDALKSFAGVFLQQGRAVLDSDWNELVEMFERRIRAGTVDTIGRAVVPRETPHGFEIRGDDGTFLIGRGRFYLDGMLCENFGDPTAQVFDRGRMDDGATRVEGVLDEMISTEGGDFIDYRAQPFWPTPTDLPDGGTHLAYLVAWQREVTPTEMPELLEPALGGHDTTTRWQTVWQVRVLPNVGDGATCQTPDADLNGWNETRAPSTARLTNGLINIDDPEDPCLVPPTEGYTGVENQFYRVELHDARSDQNGPQTWRFKFSRENASVRANVTAIASDGLSVTVSRIGRDEVLRFSPGDWVELTDDHREFDHVSGQMLRVAEIDPETRTVSFESPVAGGLVPTEDGDTLETRHTRLIRWDQRGVIRLEDGTDWADLDADGSDGLIPVPADGSAVVLESGITVQFSTVPGPGSFRAMDHWRFAARTAGTQIEPLTNAPPEGVQRHYAKLAVGADEIFDCRIFWPPEFEAGESDGCACTVCVTAEGHNSGALTIQQAIAQVGPFGGTVCLDGGIYNLREPIRISNEVALTIRGQGLGTFLAYRGQGGAIQIDTAIDLQLEEFTVIATAADGQNLTTHGITAVNCTGLAARRLTVLVATPETDNRIEYAFAVDGTQIATKLEECVLIGPVAFGSRSSLRSDLDDAPQFVALAELRAEDNVFFARTSAVLFAQAALNISAMVLARNLVWSMGTGLAMQLVEIPAGSLSIDTCSVIANRNGMGLAAGTLRVQDCEISAGDESGNGIILVPSLLPDTPWDAQLIGNTVFDCAGTGILIASQQDTVLIKRNIIRDCGQAGINMLPGAFVRHLAIDNNSVQEIGGAGAFALGIGLLSVESAQVVGNAVREVRGPFGNGQRYAGISLQGVGSVDISGNVLAEIGAQGAESSAAAILAMPPFLGLTLTNNRIFGALENTQEALDWQAIRIGTLLDDGANDDVDRPFTGITGDLPGLAPTDYVNFRVGERVWTATSFRVNTYLPAVPAQVTCSGNQIRTAQSQATPILSAVVPGAQALGLANNQIDLSSRGGLFAVGVAAAPRLTVNANTVTHQTDATSLRLFCNDRSGAVIGNVTSSNILLNNNNLPRSFAPLNLNI